ncbi:MAG: alginate lyase family protein [Acidobacteriota bacterium]|nr:alginate lyase family protein [Acidobacteriota bacterium]
MSLKIPKKIIFAFFLLSGGSQIIFGQTPQVFLLNPKTLMESKAKLANPKNTDETLKASLASLEKQAQKDLKTEFVSITTKEGTPPSNDKHDYMSQAPYFWRNPNMPNGLPYIRRDGERNPEIKKFPDHELLDKTIDAVENLSLAFYFTNNEKYAVKAAAILRMWFLDKETKMNPNLEYAQAVPGVNTGRGIGLIETRDLTRIVDAAGILKNSKSWTADDHKNIQIWFANFLKWMTTSKNGTEESEAKNNHGTFYDVQAVSFALFTGQNDYAKKVLETAKKKRLGLQIKENGAQPLELERTKSWDYSVMNLEGLVMLATYGESLNVDLWHYESAENPLIRRSIEFLFQNGGDVKNWKYEQIEPLKFEKLFPLMHRAAPNYADANYRKMLSAIPAPAPPSVSNLTGW